MQMVQVIEKVPESSYLGTSHKWQGLGFRVVFSFRYLQQKALNLKLHTSTRNPKPQSLRSLNQTPDPCALNAKPETLKPQPLSPKTLNSKPKTPKLNP